MRIAPKVEYIPTFSQWMALVDKIVQAEVGCSVHDLTDQPFRDWYDDDIDPDEAAALALEDNGWEG